LAFKPSISAFYSNASPYNNVSIYNEAYSIPKSFYFYFGFFDYGYIKTENVTYIDKGPIKPNHPLILIRENYLISGLEKKECYKKFEFDASANQSFKEDFHG